MTKAEVINLILAYVMCGFTTAVVAVVEKCNKGEFNPHTADEDDEEAIGKIALLWWLYLWHRFIERKK